MPQTQTAFSGAKVKSHPPHGSRLLDCLLPRTDTTLTHLQYLIRLFSKVLIASAISLTTYSLAKSPNILLIVSEDNGQELGCYGEPYVKTPVLDQLASEGVLFKNAYVAQAGCSQSRAAFLTGLYPHQNGQIGLATWKFRMYREDTPNIVRSLKNAGYRTGIIGKLHVNPESAFPFDFEAIGAVECAGQGRFGQLPDELPYDRLPVQFDFRPPGEAQELISPEISHQLRVLDR